LCPDVTDYRVNNGDTLKKAVLIFSYLNEYFSNVEHAVAMSLNTVIVTLCAHNDTNRVTYCI